MTSEVIVSNFFDIVKGFLIFTDFNKNLSDANIMKTQIRYASLTLL